MLTRTVGANLGGLATASLGTLLPSGSTTSGDPDETSNPSSDRRFRYFSNVPEGGTSPRRISASSSDERPSASNDRHSFSWRATKDLRRKMVRNPSKSGPSVSPGKVSSKPLLSLTPA